MTLDPDLEAAENPWGGQRFFPPGQHPVIARMCDQLARVRELDEQLQAAGFDRASCAATITHLEKKIAAFEEHESEQKLQYLLAVNHGELR